MAIGVLECRAERFASESGEAHHAIRGDGKGDVRGHRHIARNAGLNFFRAQRDPVIEPVVAPHTARIEPVASGWKLACEAALPGDPGNSLFAFPTLPDEFARHPLRDIQCDGAIAFKRELPAVGIARRVLARGFAPLMFAGLAEGKRMRSMALRLGFRRYLAQACDQPCVHCFGKDHEPVTARREAFGARAPASGRGEGPALRVFEARREFTAETVEIEAIFACAGNFEWNERAFAPAEACPHAALWRKQPRLKQRRGRCGQSEMPSRFRSFDRDPVIARTQVRLQKRVMPGAVVRRRGKAGQKCRSQAQRGFQQAEGFDPVEPAFGNRQLEATLFVAFEIEIMGFARRECGAGHRRCDRRQRCRLLLPGIVPRHYDGPVFLQPAGPSR